MSDKQGLGKESGPRVYPGSLGLGWGWSYFVFTLVWAWTAIESFLGDPPHPFVVGVMAGVLMVMSLGDFLTAVENRDKR